MGPLLPALIPLFFLVVLPLGVAGQNIGMGVSLAATLIAIYLDKAESLRNAWKQPLLKQFLTLWLLLIACITLSTFWAEDRKQATRFFWGYLYGALIPVIGVMLVGRDLRGWAERLLQFVLCLLGVVSISQLLWGWKFEGGEFVTTIHRAQGFYSHPLTLAYVCLVAMPWSIAKLFRKDRAWIDGVVCAATMAIVLCSQSVTVIALTLVVGLFAVFKLLANKERVMVLCLGGAISIGIMTTPNFVSNKIHNVLSGERGDHETNYPDDRMAFWHAHWEMFKDKPVLGHGTGLESEDRAPYYAKIGLPDIKRKYEAHNMYLEYAVEGGITAFAAFVGLLIWLVRIVWMTKGFESWERFYLLATPLAFAAGGLTQNAIQDSEVRYIFLGFTGVLINRVCIRSQRYSTHQVSE